MVIIIGTYYPSIKCYSFAKLIGHDEWVTEFCRLFAESGRENHENKLIEELFKVCDGITKAQYDDFRMKFINLIVKGFASKQVLSWTIMLSSVAAPVLAIFME